MAIITVVAFVFMFLARLRFPRRMSIPEIIRSRYGSQTLRLLRRFEKLDFKYKKTLLDLEFLMDCIDRSLTPKFVQFRVANKHLRSSTAYKKCQLELLTEEKKIKQSRLKSLEKDLSVTREELKLTLSFLDLAHVSSVFLVSNDKLIKQQRLIQEKKLFNLTIEKRSIMNPDNIIHNFTDLVLTAEEKSLLCKGLNFSIVPNKLNYANYCINYELLYRDIVYMKCGDTANKEYLKTKLKEIALTSFRNYNNQDNRPDNLSDGEFKALKSLASKQDIIIQKADKGNSILLIDKVTYTNCMINTLSDASKFSVVNIQSDKEVVFIEEQEKVIRKVIENIYKAGKITKQQHDKIRPIGSQPGVMYGLGKLHKPLQNGHLRFRPILSAIGTSTYHLAKFLVPLLFEITTNEHTINSSFEFAKDIQTQDSSLFMASFDVDSLFTNIPLEETIDICINRLFVDKQEVSDLSKDDVRDLLNIATKESFFLFGDSYYKQTDGVAMGSPLGPTLANVFMSYHEKKWLDECPEDFKPVYYRRYVDDVFLLFKSREHVIPFQEYLSSRHTNINFTKEQEVSDKLSFLDVDITREAGRFVTSVYRKPSFTGLYTHYESLISPKYSLGLILTLLHRCFNICSSFQLFHEEVSRLTELLLKNGYPLDYIDFGIRLFLNKLYTKKIPVSTVKKKQLFLTLPFLGKSSLLLKQQIQKVVQKNLPFCNLRVIFKSGVRLSNFFSFKDKVPRLIRSHLVYRFTCSDCNIRYYGTTERHGKTRWSEHMGVSLRTGKSIKGLRTAIRDHLLEQEHKISFDDFNFLATDSDHFRLIIKESLCIKKDKPQLNKNLYSTPLFLF